MNRHDHASGRLGSFDRVVARFANDNFAQDDRAVSAALARASAGTAAVLFVLFDDEVVGHTGDVITDHAGQRFLAGFLLIVVRQG